MNKKIGSGVFLGVNLSLGSIGFAGDMTHGKISALEEIIVTAQKREATLQQTPISISVLDGAELKLKGIHTLREWFNGAVPSVQASPNGNTPSTVVFSIRGNGPADPAPVTRDPAVIPYIDGVPLALPQGLSMEINDVERVEVLRGPQGTLYGRNATGGAINFITKRPTGNFGFNQSLSIGRFDELRSVTRLNLPEFGDIRAKADYVYAERDGWVKNPGETDYNAYKKQGGKFTLDWTPSDVLSFEFATTVTRVESTQLYPQIRQNFAFDNIPEERTRQTETRFSIPLDPSVVDINMSSVTATYVINDTLTLKSTTGYNDLEEGTRSNYGGTLYAKGLVIESEIDHQQLSQELQLTAEMDSIDWVVGLFYFDDNVRDVTQSSQTIDVFLDPIVLIDPPIVFPASRITQDASSKAVFGQLTWSPVTDLHFTVGARHTYEYKNGRRFAFGDVKPFEIDDSNFDHTLIAAYDIHDDASVYASHKTAFRVGGVNPRSLEMAPYFEEKVKTTELGLKTTLFDNTVKLNTALFRSSIDGAQIDVFDPMDIQINETINAVNTSHVRGLELDLSVILMPGLQVSLAYTYLDGDMPEQPNPLDDKNPIFLEMTKTPNHAGALSVDYAIVQTYFGDLAAHIDISSSDQNAHVATDAPRGGRTIANARLSLNNIGVQNSDVSASVWVKNITDEQYTVLSFPTTTTLVDVYGDPRTFGLDLVYDF